MSKSIIANILASRLRPTERTNETVKYLFCHQEIIRTCEVVMSGYDPDKHLFIDPGENIQDYFERFLDVYESLHSDTNVMNLPLTDFRGFTLTERNVCIWNKFEGIDEELQLVKAYVPIDSYVPDEQLRVMAYELREMLVDFDKYKQQELIRLLPNTKTPSITFDDSSSTITVGANRYITSLTAIPLVFLRKIVERKGLAVGNKVLADIMKLNSNTKDSDNKSLARPVQDVKNKLLKPKLKSIGIPDKEIRLIFKAIIPVRGVGYRFSPRLP